MQNDILTSLTRLSDAELVARVQKAMSYGPKALEPVNLFRNKSAGGASLSTRSAGVEPRR